MFNAVRRLVLFLTLSRYVSLAATSCSDSDDNLLNLQSRLCKSLGCSDACPCMNDTRADGDWPSQATYMNDILSALVSPETCLNTSTANEFVAWLDITDTDKSFWWYTWLVFQVQYYDMPRLPGTRIESPGTLGRKCWAFSYLKDIWFTGTSSGADALEPALATRIAEAGLNLDAYFSAYEDAVPLTMNLCWEVMANCFVNASYDPMRNGTCPGKVKEFYLGFERENIKRRSPIYYPFL